MKSYMKYIHKVMILFFAFLGTYGINYICYFVVGIKFSNSIFSIFIYIGNAFLLNFTYNSLKDIIDVNIRKKQIIYASLLSLLFACMLVVGYQIKTYNITLVGLEGQFLSFLYPIFLSISMFPFINMFISGIRKYSQNLDHREEYKNLWNTKKIFIISLVIIFICWIPVFLAYYPSIMAYDFIQQSEQAMEGFSYFSSHHPLVHTWLIWFFLQIGLKLGSLENGMALYSVFQMLILTSALSYSLVTIYRLSRKKWLFIITLLFYGIFPFISVFSIEATKDVIFTALFLVFILLFIERMFLCEGTKKRFIDCVWILEGILMILFRNNAIYAVFLLGIVLVIFIEKKEKVKIGIIMLLMILGGQLAFGGVAFAIGTKEKGNPREKYSVMIQQLASVGYYQKEFMDEETHDMIDELIHEEYWERYNPYLADTMKECVDYYGDWEDDMYGVFHTWAVVGLKYPKEYIDAFLTMTSGYWFIDDVTWGEVLNFGIEGRMGALYTYMYSESDAIPEGIAHESKFPQLEIVLEKIVSGNAFYNWPVASNLFKPSLYCWFVFLNLIMLQYTKQKKKGLIAVFPLLYLLTLLLGPVVNLRYVLPIMVSVPLLVGLFMMKNEGRNI